MKKRISLAAFSLVVGLAGVNALAEPSLASLGENNYQGLPYLNGGIGDEERAELQSREKDFNLKLVFAEKTGSYLADVNVVVFNAKGQSVFQLDSAGPILIARLPAGNYRVLATANGQAQQARLGITGKGRQARTFYW